MATAKVNPIDNTVGALVVGVTPKVLRPKPAEATVSVSRTNEGVRASRIDVAGV
jgi:hypothetical protein